MRVNKQQISLKVPKPRRAHNVITSIVVKEINYKASSGRASSTCPSSKFGGGLM